MIENVKNLTWVAVGTVYLLDTSKQVRLESGNTGVESLTPNGIQFNNCDNIKFEGEFISTDNREGLSWPEAVHPDDAHKIVPAIDFYNCGKVHFNVKMGGRGLPVYAYSNSNPDHTAHDVMTSSYFRFSNCDRVECSKSAILSGAGKGEVYSFTKVKDLIFEDTTHFQGDSDVKFFSFGKVIDCENVRIRGIRAQSLSTGSFIDVCGGNIVYEDIVLDYPLGKFIDVTNEWGYNNVPTDSVIIRDCVINSEGMVFTSTSDGINLQPVNKMVIDNLVKTNPLEINNEPFANMSFVKHGTIRNCTIENFSYVNLMAASTPEVTPDPQIILVENVDMVSSKQNGANAMTVDTKGKTTVKNSTINMNWFNRFIVRDRTEHIDLRQSDNKIVFEECNFKNTEILLQANIEFINCTFDNVVFTPNEISGRYHKPSVKFNGVEIDFDNVGLSVEGVVTRNLFRANQLNHSLGDVVINDMKVRGKTMGVLFLDVITKADKLHVDKLQVDVEKYDASGNKQSLGNLDIFGTVLNQNNNADVFINDSYLKGRVMRLDGEASTGTNKIVVAKTIMYNELDNGNPYYSIHVQSSADLNTVVLKTVGNVYGADDDAHHNNNLSKFKELHTSNNSVNVPIK